jgi:hypothetical protein
LGSGFIGPEQALAQQLREVNPGKADDKRREQRGDHKHDDEFASHLGKRRFQGFKVSKFQGQTTLRLVFTLKP